MSNPNALLLLADHIKLSLLEQQRAKTLKLSRDSQDGHISRSLDQFREGIEALEREQQRLEELGQESKATSLGDTLTSLRKQHTDLTSQFHGSSTTATTATLTSPNDPLLAPDFAHAQSSNPDPPPPQTTTTNTTTKKSVRFSSPKTSTDDDDLEAQRANLFPYRDTPDSDPDSAGYTDHIASQSLTNTQIHAYHQQILSDQDAQLDALSTSIGRQRELSMQIGDELDTHVLMLDESERAADRQANALGRARRQVGRIARGAAESGEGRQIGAIVILIVVLVLLIKLLK